MAETIILPKLGNTVESAILLAWHAAVGDAIQAGDLLCEIETDKATVEVESSASGILLARLAQEGDEVPVLADIALVGAAGESLPEAAPERAEREAPAPRLAISPRALKLAQRKGIDHQSLRGSGPGGRIIERDVQAALEARVTVTPVAQAMLDSGAFQLKAAPAGGARISKADLQPASAERGVTEIPLSGRRKTIAARMLQSLQNSAQLTLNATADARALKALRRRFKDSDEALGLRGITLNDLLLFATARTLPAFPALNGHFDGAVIKRYQAAHLGMAVDCERGLLVPVIRDADSLPLKALAAEARRLADACRADKATPQELSGGSFTVSNLGAYGIESFTPLLNPPQVAILGVGSISSKALPAADSVEFQPHISLSLTVNHQVVDGAPAARFLQRLSANIKQIDLLLAL